MNDAIKVIPTKYDGYFFRSRLEARWAVFFKAIGVQFDYEPEGYEFGGIRYLPDFHLPDHKLYIEVKGQLPTDQEIDKASMLSAATNQAVMIFHGNIKSPPTCAEGTDESAFCVGPAGVIDYGFAWCDCEYCGMVGIQYQGRAERLPCGCYADRAWDGNTWHCVPQVERYDSPRMKLAAEKARSAQFEYGAAP